MEAIYGAAAFVGLKLSTILVAGIMAVLGIMVDTRRHSFRTAVMIVIAGAAMAVLLTDPLVDFFHLSDVWKNAVAGLLGIGGRNIVVSVNRLARDPGYLMRIWRGQRDE